MKPIFQCSKLCHEPCDRPVCTEPCRRKLPCSPKGDGESHYCVGVCGEKCPTIQVDGVKGKVHSFIDGQVDLCAVCHPERMAEIREIFLGFEDEEDAKFIQLPECGHILEMLGLDGYIDSTATPLPPGDDQVSFIDSLVVTATVYAHAYCTCSPSSLPVASCANVEFHS